MLTNTFLHIRGVGQKTERRLWRSGILSWDDFLARWPDVPLGPTLAETVRGKLVESLSHLRKEDIDYFAKRLPKSEYWRLYPRFSHLFGFLDIETTGLSKIYNRITVVGIYGSQGARLFIRHKDLHEASRGLSSYRGLVTFNGTLFDLPFLQRDFPDVKFPQAHIDLRFLCQRLGHKGGLKAVEWAMGIRRDEAVSRVSGYEATVLWSRYRRGDRRSLLTLLQYNVADIVNLREVLEKALTALSGLYPELPASAFRPVPMATPRVRAAMHPRPVLRVGRHTVPVPKPPEDRYGAILATLLHRFASMRRVPKVVGIDLSGKPSNPTGWAAMQGARFSTCQLRSDREIVEATVACEPALVSIDAPLSLPKGRHCSYDHCWCRKWGITRKVERDLFKSGVSVYPCLIPSMQALTRRGMKLAKRLRSRGLEVIESYPGAAQDILGIPRKRASREELQRVLASFGLRGDPVPGRLTHHELDAITSALVGYFYLARSYTALGDKEEGLLIVPKEPKLQKGGGPPPDVVYIGLAGLVYSGKTTVGRYLQRHYGMGYRAYGELVKKRMPAGRKGSTKEQLQDFGLKLDRTLGGKRLSQMLLDEMPGKPYVAVDGIRFRSELEELRSVLCPSFHFVFIDAPKRERQVRFGRSAKPVGSLGKAFSDFENHRVEAEAPQLKDMANSVLKNNGTVRDLHTRVNQLMAKLGVKPRRGRPCR